MGGRTRGKRRETPRGRVAVARSIAHSPLLNTGNAKQKNQSLAAPAGLRNLGNTCYVNAALQFLAAIPAFTRGLYALEPAVLEDGGGAAAGSGGGGGAAGGGGGGGGNGGGSSGGGARPAGGAAVAELRSLLLALEYGPWAAADPTDFARALQIDHAVQQDGQEFLKLLLAKLEGVMARSRSAAARGAVPRLFRGAASYATTCASCGLSSEASRRATDYYELPLQVQGFRTLAESLVGALAEERLDGGNRVACERGCGGARRDAARQLVLRACPPYLCLSLQRFVFDVKVRGRRTLLFPLCRRWHLGTGFGAWSLFCARGARPPARRARAFLGRPKPKRFL